MENGRTARTAVVIDEWELLGLGITGVLDECGIRTVARVREGRAGVKAARQHRADVVVLGACADGQVADALRQARRLSPAPLVAVLVHGALHAELPRLLALGADAMLVRSAASDELADAVSRMCKGERVVAPVLLPSILGTVQPASEPDPGAARTLLTRRESEVLARIAQGRTNREIAGELFVGEETVKSHLSKLYDKLDAKNRHDAVARALALGLLG